MTAGEGGELNLEPFVHIQREDELEDGEGAERQNITINVERMLVEATEMGEGKLAQDQKIEGGEEANVIKASKTIDEALNEIDNSYWKTRVEDQKVRENHSEIAKVKTYDSEARKPSDSQAAINNAADKMINPNPWADHSHEAVNRTVRLIKEKNKESKIEEPPAIDRVKREGIPMFLESKGFQKNHDDQSGCVYEHFAGGGSGLVELQKIGSGSGSTAFSILTGAM